MDMEEGMIHPPMGRGVFRRQEEGRIKPSRSPSTDVGNQEERKSYKPMESAEIDKPSGFTGKVDESIIIPLLARRSCHLPGNDWCADWNQWYNNNHILFGICLHHPWHPVERWERSVALVASISFSLVATNMVYQMYVRDPESMETEVYTWRSWTITQGMLFLWTLGGLCHSIFDMIIWQIQACSCCHPGGRFGESRFSNVCQNMGSILIMPAVVMLFCLAIYLILWRASQANNSDRVYSAANFYDNEGGDDDLAVDIDSIREVENFSFLLFWAVEMVISWLIYFPIVGTIIFTGVLGCNGRIPVLGGRPYDIKMVQEMMDQSRYAEL